MQQRALAAAYRSARPRMPGVTFEQFRQAVSTFDVHPIQARGRLCGAVLIHGKEIHACVLPWARGRWFGRHAARLLNEVIERHGQATTQATTDEGRRFVEALGFIQDGDIYRSTKTWVLNR